ncbi:hypothetical protein [Umezawaea sp. Da 62-37]|uniref:hypothetical protein n=1 Tax=Umezawaea sp. Da 62-37 TaxID=3075927 RepID=UPI0028F6D4C5|nr:hypothetical protein [Umezawaea sp. Da 62-37]WNV82779.1 hypothetical protein RM788_31870 [Umezawaea sp. Da 62-37]
MTEAEKHKSERQGLPKAPAAPGADQAPRRSGAKVALGLLAGLAAVITLYALFWNYGAPAISRVVGPVPVLSVIAGWLQGGGALAFSGFVLVNQPDLLERTAKRAGRFVAAWLVLGLLAVPNTLDVPALHPDYHAGLYAGGIGLLSSIVVVPIGVLLLWKPFQRGESTKESERIAYGYGFIVYSVLVLLYAATVMRMGWLS